MARQLYARSWDVKHVAYFPLLLGLSGGIGPTLAANPYQVITVLTVDHKATMGNVTLSVPIGTWF